MIIEHYRDQDLNKLRENVVSAYNMFLEKFNEEDSKGLYFYYEDWHPELSGQYNDTWKLINMLEKFGYHSYYYDTVLYTSEFQEYDNQEKIIGDGLTFNQAVCNMFVNYAMEYERRIKLREIE